MVCRVLQPAPLPNREGREALGSVSVCEPSRRRHHCRHRRRLPLQQQRGRKTFSIKLLLQPQKKANTC